jgi:hypothetical protein
MAPLYAQWNSSPAKTFKITERMSFHLRFDAANVSNHPSLDNPTADLT